MSELNELEIFSLGLNKNNINHAAFRRMRIQANKAVDLQDELDKLKSKQPHPTNDEIEEMCEVITSCNLSGDNLVNYVKDFLSECAAGEDEKGKYYCQCSNKNCGSWFNVSEIGVTCSECEVGTMQPQGVEPY